MSSTRQCRTVFITGGTGFLGSFLISAFLQNGYRVVALVRGPNPRQRLYNVLRDVGDRTIIEEPETSERVEIVEGDVRAPGLGIEYGVYKKLACEVDEIWHCAASFKYQEQGREETLSVNIGGAEKVLDFALECGKKKVPAAFFVGTAFAAPVFSGVAREELPLHASRCRNIYERSKQEAERLVNKYREKYRLPVLVFRPTVVIGHSVTGKAVGFSGYYDVFRALYLLGRNRRTTLRGSIDLKLRILANPNMLVNLVPIDFVVNAMLHMSHTRQDGSFIFHVAHDSPAPLRRLFDIGCETLGVSGIELVDEVAFQQKAMTRLEQHFNRLIQFDVPYLLDSPLFDTSNFRRVVPRDVLPCPQVDEQFLQGVNRYYLGVLEQQFIKWPKWKPLSHTQPPITSVDRLPTRSWPA